MDDGVLTLFEDYAAARARGERPDPLDYLERAGDGAARLQVLIERLLMTTSPPEPAPEVVALMQALVADEPPLLGARLHRRLGVDGLVDALVERFALGPRRAKVKRLYQQLEGGIIDPRGIDPRLAEALAHILGIRPRDIALRPRPPAGQANVLFARASEGPILRTALAAPADTPEPDEVDRLFGLG